MVLQRIRVIGAIRIRPRRHRRIPAAVRHRQPRRRRTHFRLVLVIRRRHPRQLLEVRHHRQVIRHQFTLGQHRRAQILANVNAKLHRREIARAHRLVQAVIGLRQVRLAQLHVTLVLAAALVKQLHQPRRALADVHNVAADLDQLLRIDQLRERRLQVEAHRRLLAIQLRERQVELRLRAVDVPLRREPVEDQL